MSKPRTLRGQLLFWVIVPLTTLWIISTLVDHEIAKGFVNLNYDRALLDTALDLGRNVRETDNRLYLDLPKPIIEMLLTDEQGRYFYRAKGPTGKYITGDPDLPDPPSAAAVDRVVYFDATYRGRPIRAVAVRVPVRPGSGKGALLIEVAEHASVRNESARQLMLRMMIPQGFLVLLAALAIWFGVGIGLRSLNSIRREIENRSHVDLSPIADTNAPGEIRPLVHAMNDLLSRLSAALLSQQRFIADAAHQLRTPISALRTQTEVALRQVRDDQARAALQQLQSAANHAGRVITQLLTMTRAEPGSHRSVMRQPVELRTLAREIAAEWVPRALERGIDLGLDDTSDAVEINADSFLIREMLNNLIDNAICYVPAGGRVTVRVRVRHENDTAAVEVEDDGPGIPETERERVFERFYRLPSASAEGCGLGLAIVREIALGHQATPVITAGAGGQGTRVVVTFPLLR